MQIEAENLGKRFNREWIFRAFSFTFLPNHTYAIVGPNGSGKSTLLQTLWGQVPPSEGFLRYHSEGKEIPSDEFFTHLVIAAPYMELIEEFTLLEMIEFHFRFKRLKPNLKLNEVVERMELAHSRNKRIGLFSSGMKQRLKLALAFYSEAQILFIDEPTTNLDENATAWYLENLRQLKDQIVLVASNQGHEYPQNAQKINLSNLKPAVTKREFK